MYVRHPEASAATPKTYAATPAAQRKQVEPVAGAPAAPTGETEAASTRLAKERVAESSPVSVAETALEARAAAEAGAGAAIDVVLAYALVAILACLAGVCRSMIQ